jgi:hypothetical protein
MPTAGKNGVRSSMCTRPRKVNRIGAKHKLIREERRCGKCLGCREWNRRVVAEIDRYNP